MISAPIDKLTDCQLEGRARYHRTLADLYRDRQMENTAKDFLALAKSYEDVLQKRQAAISQARNIEAPQ